MRLIKILTTYVFLGALIQNPAAQNLFTENFSSPSQLKIEGIKIGTTRASSVLTNITSTSNEVPRGYYLGQNFPNTFNPLTNIYFSIPLAQLVKITVTDMLGKQVAVIVNEKVRAGTYKADFDASGLSSGVYFYRLETENFSQVRKMSLVK